jgi:hypothetical protein
MKSALVITALVLQSALCFAQDNSQCEYLGSIVYGAQDSFADADAAYQDIDNICAKNKYPQECRQEITEEYNTAKSKLDAAQDNFAAAGCHDY